MLYDVKVDVWSSKSICKHTQITTIHHAQHETSIFPHRTTYTRAPNENRKEKNFFFDFVIVNEDDDDLNNVASHSIYTRKCICLAVCTYEKIRIQANQILYVRISISVYRGESIKMHIYTSNEKSLHENGRINALCKRMHSTTHTCDSAMKKKNYERFIYCKEVHALAQVNRGVRKR